MITLDQMRKIDPDLAGMNDEQLEEIRGSLYDIALLAYDVWREKKSGSKNPLGLFPYPEHLGTIKPCKQKKTKQA